MKLVVLLLLLAFAHETPQSVDSIWRIRLAELFFSDGKEAYLKAGRDLIDYHAAHDNEKQLFDAYATLFERLQMWGRYDEASAMLEEMSSVAQARKSELGAAVTEYCFGYFYLENHQPAEAEIHYRKAFHALQELGEDNRAIRAGYNLQAIAMNLGVPETGLAINDSTTALLRRIEEKAGKPSVPNRYRQARYRLVLLLRLNRTAEAEALKDTLLHYYEALNDSALEEGFLTAMAQLEQQTGRKEAAYSCLDTLIMRNLNLGNWLKVARFRLGLADFQRENGDLELAVDNYRAYATASDSAQVHRTNEQLNELSKKYELDTLRLKNQASRQRAVFFAVLTLVMFVLTLASLIYARNVHRRNRALYQASVKVIQAEQEAEHSLTADMSSPSGQVSPSKKLYAAFLQLMNEEQLFKNPALDSTILCNHLTTNRTYLSQAVKKCSGQTLMMQINHFRLRWAAEKLVNDRRLSIATIAEEAGFSSRSTFYRMFYEEYGISPSAYRSAAFSD